MKLFSLSVCMLLACVASAQQPFSFGRVNLAQTVPTKALPQVDAAALLAEDAVADKAVPYRFGFKHAANLNQSNAGIVETLKDGSKLWRVGIKCPGAFSVNLIFDEYRLPEGAYLYIYNKDRSYVIGPYTSKNNTWDNIFGSDIVPGEEIVVEYYEPFYAAFPGQLKIGHVTHGYRDPFKMAKGFNDSGNCHNNSICPVGADWQDEKRSVAILLTGGNAFCTGAMVGNATLDGTPYFLTADHCLMPPYSAWVFRFNYESSQCTPSLNGPTNNVVTGAVLRANYENSDVALLELNSPPNPAHQVYYAGWNKENTPASAIVGIHHPSGDIKKISFDDNTILSSGYFSSTGNDHWTVNWDNGVTEGGSSGSPIFDQNHRIVGQLHGGPAACGGSDLRDYYGKFSTSWTGGGTNSSRLSNWLDPANTGIAGINGYYPSQPTNALDVALVSVQQPSGSYCTGDAIEPVITLRNDGTQTLTSVVVSYTFDNVNFTTNTYTVNIPMFGLYNLTLPAVSKPSGSYTFNASLSNPNGGTDQNNANNAGASAFSMVSGGEVTFELRTDDYPNETSYIVTGPSGDTLLTSEPFASPNTVYSTSMCMAAACYNFKIFDSYGDGICCSSGNGYFKVTDAAGNVLAEGGSFTSTQTKQFCVTATTSIKALAELQFSVYPNPASGTATLDWSRTLPNVRVSICDATGREVGTQQFANAHNAVLDLSGLASGLYSVRIDAGENRAVRKIAVINP